MRFRTVFPWVGLWIPTPTAFAKASGPFWGNDRPIIAGSGDNAQPGPPMAYSEDPNLLLPDGQGLYTASKSLTTDQQNWALFWRDSPALLHGSLDEYCPAADQADARPA